MTDPGHESAIDHTRTADWLVDRLARELSSEHRVPLYEQLIAALTRLIDRRLLPEGTVLPPEPELAARLGLSRQTVNQALTTLARQGRVTRRRGVGTFVSAPLIEQPLDGLYSFIRTLTAQGRRPGSRLLGTRITVDDAASVLIAGHPDGLVYEVTRIRLVDDEPVVYERVFLPVACAESLPRERLATDVLYDLLRDHCGIVVTHAEETLRPVVIAREEAALLGVAAGDPAFLVERRTVAEDRTVEVRLSLIRGDRYRFRVRLAGPMLTPEATPAEPAS